MIANPTTLSFGALLKQLRKQAGMTQRDLAAALNYSDALISSLEKAQSKPDLQAVTERFIPALGLQDDPQSAAALIAQAALARGERPPVSITFQRTTRSVVQEEYTAPVTVLPSLPTQILGRAVEVNQLCNRLLGHHGRLLTLVGPPGIGKTTLALAVAVRLQPYYGDGAVFVALAAVSDPLLMASTIAVAVGSTDTSAKSPMAQLIAFLRRKTMLLVLDNLEQIQDAATFIAALVAECPNLCILATSRERLHLRAEQRYKVPPLDRAAAVELFVQRAQAVDGEFSLTAHNQPILGAICQRLDCLPLALELCAARIDLFTPAQMLVQLQARPLDLLVDGARDLPPQQRTLRAAIHRSYALLNTDEQRLLRALGAFGGGFALPEVAAVMAGGLEAGDGRLNDDAITQSLVSSLHSLIGKSLVRSESTAGGEQRFLLLETIREFALEQLRVQGEEAMIRQRHYAAYLQLFRTADRRLRGPEAAIWLARLLPEQDNVRAALQWAFAEARYLDAAWLMIITLWFWNLHGYWVEYGGWLARLLPHRPTLPPVMRLTIFLHLYSMARSVEEFQPVERWRAEVMQLLELCPDKVQQAAVWHFIAFYATDYAEAARCWERSIELARAADEATGLGPEYGLVAHRSFVLDHSLWSYADRLISRGELARAVPLSHEALALCQARGSGYETVDSLGNLGRVALLQGDLAQAHKILHEAVTLAVAYHYRAMLCLLQPILGITTLYAGDPAEAQRLLGEGLRCCQEMNHKLFLGRVCTYLAEAALSRAALDEAETWLAQSLAYHTNPRSITIYQVDRFWVAARLATAQQQFRRAATLFGLADQIHGQVHYAIAGPMRTLADAALATVREALEPALFARAFATGQQMTLADAFAGILAPDFRASLSITP